MPAKKVTAWAGAFLLGLAFLFGCSSGDPSTSSGQADDSGGGDDTTVDDSADDTQDDDHWDDDGGDDSGQDDDTVDDTDDDTSLPDDYVAPWPQNNIEPADYDESPGSGPLREKADEYDVWSAAHHQPYYGGLVHATFTDETYAVPDGYNGYGDCTIWSGTYLGGQAFRYHVTADPDAKANVIRIVNALSGHLHVTGRTGFIARYRAPQDSIIYLGDDWCDANDRCHRVDDGPFAGDFWWGETSRDQYTGWFFGMALAYDMVDDEDMRDIIRADVAEVLTELMANGWMIIDEADEPTDAGPQVLPPMRVSWLTIGYHVTGNETFKQELQKWLKNDMRIVLRFESIAFMNRYAQYYGNNLAHTNWYNILRLGKVYFNPDDYDFMVRLFESQVHTFTRLSHNPWFNGVFMGQGDYEPGRTDDPYMEQLASDLTDFPDVPNIDYALPERTDFTQDPFSVFMHDLQQQYPFLADIFGTVEYQAEEAFPVPEQCTAGFLFQQNPFRYGACGSDNPLSVHSGTDYLVAYWLASYHKFLKKDQ